jgi:hypothetical protein
VVCRLVTTTPIHWFVIRCGDSKQSRAIRALCVRDVFLATFRLILRSSFKRTLESMNQ